MRADKCMFCDMGQAKRMLIWRITRDLSKSSLEDLLKRKKEGKSISICVKPSPKSICPICNKICGNAGLLAMHMKSPARPYREIHRKYELKK